MIFFSIIFFTLIITINGIKSDILNSIKEIKNNCPETNDTFFEQQYDEIENARKLFHKNGCDNINNEILKIICDMDELAILGGDTLFNITILDIKKIEYTVRSVCKDSDLKIGNDQKEQDEL